MPWQRAVQPPSSATPLRCPGKTSSIRENTKRECNCCEARRVLPIFSQHRQGKRQCRSGTEVRTTICDLEAARNSWHLDCWCDRERQDEDPSLYFGQHPQHDEKRPGAARTALDSRHS